VDQVAFDSPWVRDTLRRARRRAQAILLVGLVLFTAFVVLADHFSTQSDWLRQSGVQVLGRVQSVTDDTRYSEGSAVVAYVAGARPLQEPVDLGANASNYHVGQTVTVYYDPRHPARMTINDESNQPGWTVMPMVFMLVLGVGGLAWGSVVLASLRRSRQLLASQPWQTAVADTVTRGAGRSKSKWILVHGRAPLRLRSNWNVPDQRDLKLLFVSEERRAVVAVPGQDKVRSAFTPRRLPRDLAAGRGSEPDAAGP
jgi:hypothetical protein